MPTVVEEIPAGLAPAVEAATRWLTASRGQPVKVTGIVDPDEALASRQPDGTIELSLILCQADACLREQIRVRPDTDGWSCSSALDAPPPTDDPPAHLDPPAGSRRGWIDRKRADHSLVLLLFYRGFW